MSAVGRRDCGVAAMMMTGVVVVTVSSLYRETAGVAIAAVFAAAAAAVAYDGWFPYLPLPFVGRGATSIRRTGAMSTYLGLGEGLRWLLVPDNTSLLRRFHLTLFPACPFSLSLFRSLVPSSDLLSFFRLSRLYGLCFILVC